MSNLPDVDIDVANRDRLLALFDKWTTATLEDGKKHNTGVYFTDIPYDALNDTATFDYKSAEELGYFKLDILNVSVYQMVNDYDHLDAMMDREPPWERLWTDPDYTANIIHIGSYYNLLQQMKPDSIERMAMFLAVIRPSKRHLVGKSWKEVAETIWDKPEDDSYYFKKSHSVSYAHLVKLHMNLLDTLN